MTEIAPWVIAAYVPSLLCAAHILTNRIRRIWLVACLAPIIGPAIYLVLAILDRRPRARPVPEAGLRYIRDYKEAQEARAKLPSLQNHIAFAQAAAELNFREESEGAWRAALNGGGANNPIVLLGYAQLLTQHRQYVEALALLETWQSLGESETGAIALMFARVYKGLSRHADADAAFRRAIAKESPFKARAHYVAFLAEHGRTDEARELFSALHQEFMDMPKDARLPVDYHLSVARRAVAKHGVI
ncbi:MAG: hypothetical protein NT015_02105 [Alphaproteobacteria bacterium]|nr:hypothetical protein [Alphaproteobacteria bacterium]